MKQPSDEAPAAREQSLPPIFRLPVPVLKEVLRVFEQHVPRSAFNHPGEMERENIGYMLAFADGQRSMMKLVQRGIDGPKKK